MKTLNIFALAVVLCSAAVTYAISQEHGAVAEDMGTTMMGEAPAMMENMTNEEMNMMGNEIMNDMMDEGMDMMNEEMMGNVETIGTETKMMTE